MSRNLKVFFQGVWWVITFPVRVLFTILAFPFKLINRFLNFLNTEREDRPIDEIFEDIRTSQDVRQQLVDQLMALRSHFFRFMAVFVLFCVVSLYFLPSIMNLLHIPLSIIGQTKLRISGPGDILDIIPKVVFASASLLSAPYLIFEMYLFAAPGLQPIERKLGILLQFIFILFSMVTLTIAFYLILPVSLTYGAALTEQYGINDWELSRYLSFSMNILLLSALIVYYPFVIFLYVAKFHKPKISYRIIILISFLLAATITPGTMILIDAGLTVLLSLIYIPTYLTIMILYRAPRNPQAAGQRA